MSDVTAHLHDYLDRYAASLSGFDAEAAADLWAQPGMIVDDGFSGVLESREAMVEGLRQSYPLYRQLGLASVGYELLREQRLSAALTMVFVRWLFRDADGGLLTDSSSYYLLRRDDEGLHACVCIQTDSTEKLRALAAERGVEIPAQES